MRAPGISLVTLAFAAWGCGLNVSDVRCRADADCDGDHLCIGGFCDPPVARPDAGPPPPPPPPDAGPPPQDAGPPDAGPLTANLTATPATVSFGETVTLQWTSSGGECTLDGAPVANDDQLVLDQPVPFAHTLVCTDGAQSARSTATVDVTCNEVVAVPAPVGAITTAAELDAWVASLGSPGCYRVTGNLNILAPDLVDLRALYGFTEAQFNLIIDQARELRSLEGLGLLVSVGSGLRIGGNTGNDQLVDLRGLDALGEVDDLVIQDNLRLESLRGLESLRDIFDLLSIDNNIGLADLDALTGLERVGRIDLRNNDRLADLSPMAGWQPQPTQVLDLVLRANPAVTDLTPLSWITEIDFFEIEQMERLESLAGLENVVSIAQLDLIGNDALIDVSALADLSGQMTCFRIESNENLASITGFNNIDMIDGGCRELTFRFNAPGFVVDGFASVSFASRLELAGAADARFPALTTAETIFIDDTLLTDTNVLPALNTVTRLRIDDADRAAVLTLPSAAITSLTLINNDLADTINVNGATATCWAQNNNLALPQAEIDRVTGILGAPQAECP